MIHWQYSIIIMVLAVKVYGLGTLNELSFTITRRMDMISKKGKRRFEFEGNIFYWFVRANAAGHHRIHIISEDKKINLEFPPFDSEVPVEPSYIRELLKRFFDESTKGKNDIFDS